MRNECCMPDVNIRVLVVDDSPLIRRMISDAISETPDMEVIDTACDGAEAVEKFRALDPDVVTMDIQMPGVDGLEALDQMLALRPAPVIMVSSLTQRAADVTLGALDRGAMDYIAKPDSAARAETVLRDDLIRKIRAAHGADVSKVMQIRKRRRTASAASAAAPACGKSRKFSADHNVQGLCIAIGISTGGPPALTHLFENLAPPMPPIVVVQHMPAQFTGPFAQRLDRVSELAIKEAQTGDQLQSDHVFVAPGGLHLYLKQRGSVVSIDIRDGEPVSNHKPSVDVMMDCAARIYGDRCLGVVMTGMGRDGSDGSRYIKQAGGYVLGQDQGSSDVYGMNKVAYVEGNVHEQFALDDAAAVITTSLSKLRSVGAV